MDKDELVREIERLRTENRELRKIVEDIKAREAERQSIHRKSIHGSDWDILIPNIQVARALDPDVTWAQIHDSFMNWPKLRELTKVPGKPGNHGALKKGYFSNQKSKRKNK